MVTLVLAMFGPLGSRVLPAPFDGRVAMGGCVALMIAVFARLPDRTKSLEDALLMSASAICLGAGIGFAIRLGMYSPITGKWLIAGSVILAFFMRKLKYVEPAQGLALTRFDVRQLPNDIAARYEVTSLGELFVKVESMTGEDEAVTRLALKRLMSEVREENKQMEVLLRRVQVRMFFGAILMALGGYLIILSMNR